VSRVIVLGMDGLDPYLLEKWWDDLPNFRRLRDEGTFTRLDSVFPPDSVPAWASIYTGQPPDGHGILDSVDYLDVRKQELRCDTSVLQGNTFWDVAGRQGKRVCIVNPFLAYPVWPVNGVMVNGPVFVTGEVQAHPESVLSEYDVPELGGIVGTPTKKTLAAFAQKTRQLTVEHLRFGKALLGREKWDLFFINLLALDRVQHVFWRYCDPEDPTYPGENPHSEVIKSFYRLHDQVLGEFLDVVGHDSILIALSDHGHGRRCTKAVYLNEFLRRKGLLKSSARAGRLDPRYLLERAKMFVLRTLDRYDLQDLAYKIGALIPRAKALKKSTFVIDSAGSTAGVARFAGMNPYGGIDLPRQKFDGDERAYRALLDGLLHDLRALKDPDTDRAIVKWAKRREEMFTGPHARIYPEIIFQLDPDYGVGRSLFGPLVDVNPTHKKISGGHMPEAALLANSTLPLPAGKRISVVSIAGVILRLLDLEAPGNIVD